MCCCMWNSLCSTLPVRFPWSLRCWTLWWMTLTPHNPPTTKPCSLLLMLTLMKPNYKKWCMRFLPNPCVVGIISWLQEHVMERVRLCAHAKWVHVEWKTRIGIVCAALSHTKSCAVLQGHIPNFIGTWLLTIRTCTSCSIAALDSTTQGKELQKLWEHNFL